MSFTPNTQINRQKILETIGVSRFEDLLNEIPEQLLLTKPLDLPGPFSELEVMLHLKKLAAENFSTEEFTCFLGGGIYDHFIPSVVDAVLQRSEYYTAYTPYQAEVSQGTLQSIYEYQSLICELTGMDVSNASVYDGASATAEAALLAVAQTNRQEVICPATLHPNYQKVLATYARAGAMKLIPVKMADGVINLNDLQKRVSEKTAGVIVQQPNFFGCLESPNEIEPLVHRRGALLIAVCDPISLGILTPPGQYNADIAVGDGQSLGVPIAFGGPTFGYFTVKKEYIRRLPGRLVGMTVDQKGRRGYVLTLQTREQHIRREKATSNICTNQALCALAATVYLTALGRSGIKKVAELCVQKAHYAAEQIAKLPGFCLKFPAAFFKEFTVSTPIPSARLIRRALKYKIFAGLELGQFHRSLSHTLLLAVTEKRTRNQIDKLVQLFADVSTRKIRPISTGQDESISTEPQLNQPKQITVY